MTTQCLQKIQVVNLSIPKNLLTFQQQKIFLLYNVFSLSEEGQLQSLSITLSLESCASDILFCRANWFCSYYARLIINEYHSDIGKLYIDCSRCSNDSENYATRHPLPQWQYVGQNMITELQLFSPNCYTKRLKFTVCLIIQNK